jgi:Tol biopolymer transport system component
MKNRLPILLVAMLLATAPAWAQVRGVTAEDYLSFETLGDPHFSPDGATIAFTVTTVDQKQNRRYTTIWTVPANGSASAIKITTSPQSSNSPRWSPDGSSIAFLSARPAAGEIETGAPHAQVWLLPLRGGGEPRRVTNLPNGVSSFQWAPDGTRIVCVSRSGPSDAAKSPSDVRHYLHANYKFNDSGWFDDKRSHLWVIDAATGQAKQITSGEAWNDTDPQWSPDSAHIAFVSDRTGKAFDEGRNTDIWVIEASGGPLTKITDRPEADQSPRWSPDGRTVAFVSANEERAHPKIWLVAASGGTPRLAADGLDVIPSALRWAEEGRALYFETGVKGTTQLYRVDPAAKRAAQVTSGERTLHLVDINDKTGRMAYAVDDPTHLDDLYVADLKGQNERQLTHLNAALWKQLQLVPVERVPFKGADGWDVDGFLMKPVGFDPSKKYPLILTIHGGPAGMNGFDWYHEFQVYASHGWAVFFHEPARVDRLRREVRARRTDGMGRQGVHRHHERRRRGPRPESVDRRHAAGRHRRQLRRVHDELDCQPHDPVQGGGHAAQHLQFRQRRWDARRHVRARVRFRRRHLRRVRQLLEHVAAEIREEREDADARAPFGQRLPRADRAGRAVVPCAAALRRAQRNRVLSARESQPDAHRRTEAPRREHQLAGVLVRSVSERQRERRSA